MDKRNENYSNLRIEEVEGFRYITHTVVSSDPEGDALDRVFKYAAEHGVKNQRVIGWDFPNVSVEQANIYNMHGYAAAWVLPDSLTPEGHEIKE